MALKVKKLLLLAVTAGFNFGFTRLALADLTNPLGDTTFAQLVQKVAGIAAQIGFPIAAMAIIYAGFLFVTARGNEKQLEDAKRTFRWTIIGTAILLGAWAIATALSSFVNTLKT